MTGIARLGRRNMRRRLATGIHTVMAGGTGAGNDTGVSKSGWLPCSGSVASITGLSRRNVRRIFGLGIDG